MVVTDKTNKWRPSDLGELESFLKNELRLTTTRCLDWLDVVIEEQNNLLETSYGIYEKKGVLRCVIVINSLNVPDVEDAKEVLAYAFGLHWALSHFYILGSVRASDPLPDNYYQKRQMNPKDFFAGVTPPNCYNSPDAQVRWAHCDRALIAEDYRHFFAPPPYNQAHGMKAILPLPSDQVRQYIEGLEDPSKH